MPPGSVGYTVSDGRRKCSVVTDLGFVTEEVRQSIYGSQLALVEANHDVDWLKSGAYPPYLKRRILGDGGHLSNEDSGELCCELAEHGHPEAGAGPSEPRKQHSGTGPQRGLRYAVPPGL